MIKILVRNGRTAPIVVCDICNVMIGVLHEGAAVFNSDNAKDMDRIDVLHAHKGRCHDEAERRLATHSWQELGSHLHFVCCNSGMTIAEYAKWDEWNGLL